MLLSGKKKSASVASKVWNSYFPKVEKLRWIKDAIESNGTDTKSIRLIQYTDRSSGHSSFFEWTQVTNERKLSLVNFNYCSRLKWKSKIQERKTTKTRARRAHSSLNEWTTRGENFNSLNRARTLPISDWFAARAKTNGTKIHELSITSGDITVAVWSGLSANAAVLFLFIYHDNHGDNAGVYWNLAGTVYDS